MIQWSIDLRIILSKQYPKRLHTLFLIEQLKRMGFWQEKFKILYDVCDNNRTMSWTFTDERERSKIISRLMKYAQQIYGNLRTVYVSLIEIASSVGDTRTGQMTPIGWQETNWQLSELTVNVSRLISEQSAVSMHLEDHKFLVSLRTLEKNKASGIAEQVYRSAVIRSSDCYDIYLAQRALAICPKWFDDEVSRFARLIYKDFEFDVCPILADKMEDKGCNDELILTTLRNETIFRGHWMLDLLIGSRI